MSNPKPLDSSMPNTLAYRLGKIACEAVNSPDVGDEIDRGLILLRLLKSAGFELYLTEASR